MGIESKKVVCSNSDFSSEWNVIVTDKDRITFLLKELSEASFEYNKTIRLEPDSTADNLATGGSCQVFQGRYPYIAVLSEDFALSKEISELEREYWEH